MNDLSFPVTARLSLAEARGVAPASDLPFLQTIGIVSCDSEGLVTRYNRRAVELWGREPIIGAAYFGFDASERLFLPDGTGLSQDRTPMAAALRTGAPVRDHIILLERRDGDRLTFLVNVEPLFDEAGAIAGAINCFQDISGLKRNEAEPHESERRLRALLEALPAAVYTTDTEGRLTFYNRAAASLWGGEPRLGTTQWCGSWRLCWPDGTPLPHDECPMAITLTQNRPITGAEAVAIRPDGTRVPFLAYPSPLRDASGALTGAVNMLVEISERKQAEERQKVLLDELNHRVKNTLATVQAMATQSLRNAGVSREQREAFESRLLALSRTHDQLTQERWECAELCAIIRDIFAPHRTGFGDRVRLDGALVRLSPSAALTLAMILNELATNAVKYGSLSVPNGKLDVSWGIDARRGMDSLWLDWIESDGPVVRPPACRGFGMRLLERGITRQLQGAVQTAFDPGGFRCGIQIPLPADQE